MTEINILHIEDDFADALLVQNAVYESGDFDISFEVAKDLRETKAKVGKKDYDLILLDLRLPDSIDPKDTFDTVSALAPGIPVVVLSGSLTVDHPMIPGDVPQLDKNHHLILTQDGREKTLADILRVCAEKNDIQAV